MSDTTTPAMGNKKHLVKPAWLRIPLKVIAWIILVVALIPVLLYIPPVQTAVKNLACGIVKSRTGMDIKIDRFRLKFPLDVSLQGVSIVEASGDTMVYAREALADVKLLPLLGLDVKLNKLSLTDGYYRFLSPDSSMVMKIRAHRLEVDPKSSINIAKSDININKASLEGGDISLYMNVWKQKPTPPDTTSTPFLIKVKDLDVKNIKFGMSMLPTIDTLDLQADNLALRDGIINLRTNDITASLLTLDGGGFRYLAPTPEYVAAHPAPVDTLSAPSAPMTIKADSISVDRLKGVYAIAGAKPLPGFDANYIEVSDVGIGMRDFYNQAATLRLPLSRITARERSGLYITEGHGLIALDEEGIDIKGAQLRTPYSDIMATAGIPFALMELKPEAPVNVKAVASIGMPDVEAFMPDLREYTSKLPGRTPLAAKINASGRLDDVEVRDFDAAMAGFFSLRATGHARNVLDFKNLVASLDIDGEVVNPSPIEKFTGDLGFPIPALKIKGTAGANRSDYTADLSLQTDKGSVLADASVGLNSERYRADVTLSRFNVGHFMPDLGIGTVSANLKAHGAGFNPLNPGAATDVSLCVDEIIYNRCPLLDISLQAVLHDGDYHVEIDSPNVPLNLEAVLSGEIGDDDYTAEGDIRLYNLDLKALGFSEEDATAKADLYVDARLQPDKWLYDADMKLFNCEYRTATGDISLPSGIEASLRTDTRNVMLTVDGERTQLRFDSDEGLQKVVEGFTAAADLAIKQIDERNLDMEQLSHLLPPFTLRGEASGDGMLSEVLKTSGVGLDTLSLALSNDSLIRGNIAVERLTTGGLTLDTITLGLLERGKLLDYKLHVGNKPGSFDEFAQVNLNGYMGQNRLSAYLVQRNIQGKTGYRLGFTAAMADSVATLHFTPLKATIAYLPWVFNDDNFVTYDINTMHIGANLKAQSRESSILLATGPDEKGREELHLNLTNIHVEDFLQMSMFAPPIRASVNSDIHVRYTGKALVGRGTLDIRDFIYEKTRVGDFDFTLQAGTNLQNKAGGHIGLKINGKEAMGLSAVLKEGEQGLAPERVKLSLTEFPLSVANPFLGHDVMRLGGHLNGDMLMTGSLTSPLLNGKVACDSVDIFVPMIGSSLKINNDSITVADNILNLNDLCIYGANSNPLKFSGSVDARHLNDIKFDLSASANQFQLMDNDRRARSDAYGKVFLTLGATVKGPMKHFDVNGNLNILGNTDVYYTIPGGPSAITTSTSDGVVTFVNFNDTTSKAPKDTVPQMMAMRVRASLNISPGARACVFLSGNGTDKLTVTPSGTLNYYQNFMGDMTLNGQLYLGEGLVRYGFPVLGDKTFTFKPQSYVSFNGNIMNPGFNIKATDKIRGNVVNSSGNSHVVNFLVGVDVSGTLSAPKVVFDLSTDDDLSLQNELTAMSPDQRSMQAMNLLITGRYQGAGMKTSSGNLLTGGLYGFLTSQINQWAAQNIRGVDLSFGVDQYDKSVNGQKKSTTSYSYQVSKSLFNNKFKIVVGGNYSTDANADENFAENLLSDVSFEYMLKQTNNLSMLVKLYRHTGYESILEGQITETGVGFVMRRRLATLRNLFKVRWGKRRQTDPATVPARQTNDSTAERRDSFKTTNRNDKPTPQI